MIDSGLTNTIELFAAQSNSLLPLPSGTEAGDAALAAGFTEAYITELVMNLKAVMPALFVLYAALTAYLSTAFFKSAYNIFIPMANPGKKRKRIKSKYWRIQISSVSAVVLAAAMLLTVLFSFRDNLIASIVLTNLTYILTPGFCIVGVYFVYDKIFKSNAGFVPVILIIGAAALVFVLPVAAFIGLYAAGSLLMIVGIYATLIGDIRKFLDKAKKLVSGDDDDDDFIE